jgi:hypothetical protein
MKKEDRRITISAMLWQRKYFYFVGYLIGIIICLLSKAIGSYVDNGAILVVPISISFPFGFMLYVIIREPKRFKKEGRGIILSREGLINLALCFSSIIILGLLYKIIKLL